MLEENLDLKSICKTMASDPIIYIYIYIEPFTRPLFYISLDIQGRERERERERKKDIRKKEGKRERERERDRE